LPAARVTVFFISAYARDSCLYAESTRRWTARVLSRSAPRAAPKSASRAGAAPVPEKDRVLHGRGGMDRRGAGHVAHQRERRVCWQRDVELPRKREVRQQMNLFIAAPSASMASTRKPVWEGGVTRSSKRCHRPAAGVAQLRRMRVGVQQRSPVRSGRVHMLKIARRRVQYKRMHSWYRERCSR